VFTRRAAVVVSRTSSANAVKAVTRRAALLWGMPERVKTDNGKDYTAQDYEFALGALHVQHILCTPFSPDQKPFIERFLGTLSHDLMPMLDGFVGHDVSTRKAIESGRSFAQRFGEHGMDLYMSPEQLQTTIDAWLHEYHQRVHSELGCSPNEMAERHTQSVTMVDERALDLLLMPIADKGTRVVGKRGISLGNAYFAAPELAGVMGAQVYCRQDEADLGALHVYALDGSYICRALDHTRLGINRAELAAKARAIEAQTINPVVREFRQVKKRGLVRQAVQAIYAERDEAAIERASSDPTQSKVLRLPVRQVQRSTPAVDSLLQALPTTDSKTAQRQTTNEQARDAFDADAPVLRMDSPKQRYSTWVRLAARMSAGEAVPMREAEWKRSYEGSVEFEAWHQMHEGLDPLARATGASASG
jgi:putative transposase